MQTINAKKKLPGQEATEHEKEFQSRMRVFEFFAQRGQELQVSDIENKDQFEIFENLRIYIDRVEIFLNIYMYVYK